MNKLTKTLRRTMEPIVGPRPIHQFDWTGTEVGLLESVIVIDGLRLDDVAEIVLLIVTERSIAGMSCQENIHMSLKPANARISQN